MAGIPISSVVSVTPSVLAAGGGVSFLNGLVLTESGTLTPGQVMTFTSATAVAAQFGATSTEAKIANVYFSGFTGATQTPGTLLFAGYSAAATGGGATATAELTSEAVSGVTVTAGGSGYEVTPTVTLSGGGGTGATATATVSGGIVTAINVTNGGSGYTAAPTVTITPAASDDVPGFMDALTDTTLNWAAFTTAFEPTLADKQAFATWTGAQNNRFLYVAWDTDANATVQGNTTCFGAWLKAQTLSGSMAVYQDPLAAALALGWMASLDFGATNGRYTLAFRNSGLVTAAVTDGITAATLLANGYNFYGAYAGSTGSFVFFSNGSVSGPFAWADSFIDQIWLNGSFQEDMINLLMSVGQIPYDATGDALLSAAVLDTINQAVTFGVIRSGVTLTALQAQQVNSAAGRPIDTTLSTRGWYFLPGASTAPATSRAARTSPPCSFWYTDGGSVQSINLASVEIQ